MTSLMVEGVIETALYADDLDRMETFYRDVLHLPVHGRESDRHVFFRAGPASMLLIFKPDTTLKGDVLPGHGSRGPGHLALGIRPDALPAWRDWLTRQAVAIEKEVRWPAGGTSLYFRDPAGNSVELLTPGVWNLPTGW